LHDDLHLQQIDFFRAFEHPTEGALEVPDPGLRFNREPLPIHHHQPSLGEHSELLLREAGLSGAEIAAALG